MKLYAIRGWGVHFENNRSRTVISLDWISVPNRHDGEHYTQIVTSENGAEIFAGWILILQVASKCNPRGVLVRDNGIPHDSASLSLKTRAPKSWFDKAFRFLEANTDWFEVTDLTGSYQPPVRQVPANCEEGKGREGNRREGEEGDGLPKEASFWNNNCGTLPKVSNVSAGRRTKLNQRRQDKFWVANFETAVVRASKSDFCTGKNDRTWKADFDFILQPDAVSKIMEGKYDNRAPLPNRPAKNQDQWNLCNGRYNLENGPRREHFPDQKSFDNHLGWYNDWKQKRLALKAKSV